MANEFEKKILAEANAEKVRFRHFPQSGTTIMTRRWPRIVDQRSEDVLTYLKSIKTVVDPKMDRQTYVGEWKCVLVYTEKDKRDEDQQGYYQVLSLGDQAPFGLLQSSDCRYDVFRAFYFGSSVIPELPFNLPKEGITYQRGPTSYDADSGLYSTSIDTRVVKYRSVTNEVLESLSQRTTETQELGVLCEQPIPDLPEIQGTVYQRNISVRDDCSYDVTTNAQESKVGQIEFASFSSKFRKEIRGVYDNVNVPVEAIDVEVGSSEATNTINRDHTYSGTVTVVTPTDDGEAPFESLSSPLACEESVVYRARSAQVGTPAFTRGVVYQSSNSLRADGLYDSSFSASLSKEQEVYFRSATTAFEESSTIQFVNALGLIEAPLVTGSGAYNLTTNLNRDGTYNQTLVYRYGRLAAEAKFASERSCLLTGDSAVYKSSPVRINAPSSSQGQVYTATNSITEDGLYDARLGLQTSVDATLPWSSRNTKFSRESSIIYQNSRDKIDAPVPDQGGVYQVSAQLNRDCTYDQILTYRAGNNEGQALFDSLSSAVGDRDTVLYKSRSSQVDALPSVPRGTISTVSNSLGDDGLYDATFVKAVSKQASVGFRSRATKFVLESSGVYRNRLSKIDAPVPGAGGVYQVSASVNDDGTYNQSIVYRVSNDDGVAEFDARNSALVDRNSVVYKSQKGQLDALDNEQGIIFTASNSLGDDGLYDSSLTKDLSKEGEVGWKSRSTKFEQESSALYRNLRNKLDAPSAEHGLYQVATSLNEDGTYNQTLVYKTGTGEGEARFDSLTSALDERDLVLYKSRLEPVESFPSKEQGVITRVSNSLKDDGLYDGSLEKLESQPGELGWESGKGSLVNQKTALYKNQKERQSVPEPTHGLYTVNSSLNTDATYDQTIVYRVGKKGKDKYQSLTGALRKNVSVLYKNQTSPQDETNDVQGAVYRVENFLSDQGLYDGTLTANLSREGELSTKNSRVSRLEKSSSAIYRNRKVKLNAPPTPVHGVYTLDSRLNEDATYDQTLTYTTRNNKGKDKFESLNTKVGDRETFLYRKYSMPLDANASLPGVVYQSSFSLTSDGFYDGSIVAITSKEGKVAGDSRSTKFDASYTTITRNAPSLNPLDIPDSGVYSRSFSLNDDGTYDISLVYRYGRPGGEAKFKSSKLYARDSASVLYRKQNDPVGTPLINERGVVYTASNSLGDDGLYDASLVYTKSKPLTYDWLGSSSKFKSTYRSSSINKLVPYSVPSVDSGIYQQSLQINADGTYTENLSYTTGKDDVYEKYKSFTSRYSEASTVLYKDNKEKIVAPGFEQGYTYTAQNSLTEQGLFSGRLTAVYSEEERFKVLATSSPTSRTNSVLYYNARDLPSIPDDENAKGVYQLKNVSFNQDGTYNARVDVTKQRLQNQGLYYADARGFNRVYRWRGLENLDLITPLLSDQSFVASLNFEIREDGLYDVRISQRQASTRLPNSAEVAFIRLNKSFTIFEHTTNGKGPTGVQFRTKTFKYNVKGRQRYSQALDDVTGAKPGSYIDIKGGMFISWECINVSTGPWQNDTGNDSDLG